MNKYIITSFVECGLYFNNPQAAKEFADKYELNVCEVYYQDEGSLKRIGYGIENEDGLMKGNEFTWV